MILYTLAFTKKGEDPKHNKYLQMLWIWLRFLCRYGNMQPTDKIYILLDKASIAYLEDYTPFISLDINYTFLEIPAPTTVKEGILERFQFWNYFQPEENEIVCYIDIDMFVLKDIHWVEPICSSNTLYVFPEESILGENYLGELLTPRDYELFKTFPEVAEKLPGFSGTFYFFRGMFLKNSFERLIRNTKEFTGYLYANEQPFYNREIFDALYYTQEYSIAILKKDCIDYNCLVCDCSPEAKLLNFCGEPGVQEVHWIKLFMAFLADT